MPQQKTAAAADKRTSVLLNPRSLRELREDCEENALSLNEAIRRAITERAYWRARRQRGAKLYVQEPPNPDGTPGDYYQIGVLI